jgi:hypothetical protein
MIFIALPTHSCGSCAAQGGLDSCRDEIKLSRMKALLVRISGILLLLHAATIAALAQESAVPEIVSKGFADFQKNGALAAVNTWLSGSAREVDDDALDAATGRINQVQGVYGRILGNELIRVVTLSPSTRRIYMVVKFEKGAAWMSFDCYKPKSEWIIPSFDFYTRANLILPPNILGGQ